MQLECTTSSFRRSSELCGVGRCSLRLQLGGRLITCSRLGWTHGRIQTDSDSGTLVQTGTGNVMRGTVTSEYEYNYVGTFFDCCFHDASASSSEWHNQTHVSDE
jgi:hypothetical protein